MNLYIAWEECCVVSELIWFVGILYEVHVSCLGVLSTGNILSVRYTLFKKPH